MDNNLFSKLKIILPIVIGIVLGAILFILGEIDDSPGLCVIAIILCIGLLYLGIHNANKINKNIKPSIILPLLIGIVGTIYIAKYFIDGIFNEPPGLILIGIVLSIGLIIIGLVNIKRNRIKNKDE
jgi:uncharacterized membrane protein YiaA